MLSAKQRLRQSGTAARSDANVVLVRFFPIFSQSATNGQAKSLQRKNMFTSRELGHYFKPQRKRS